MSNKGKREQLEILLKNKAAYIALYQTQLENVLQKLSKELTGKSFESLFNLPIPPTIGQIISFVESSRYVKTMKTFLLPNQQGFNDFISFSKEVSDLLDIPFVMTLQNEAGLVTLLEAMNTHIVFAKSQEITSTMFEAVISSRLSRQPYEQVVSELSESIEVIGRRVAVEVSTGLQQYDRLLMSGLYEEAGIKLFVYHPKNVIATSRESCKRAIGSSNQTSGWTRADIERDPGLDMIKGGKPYYNCRHDWLPFIEGVTD